MGNSDSRTIFREHIQMMGNEDLSASYDFWNSLFTLDFSVQDSFQMVSDEDVERLINEYQMNLAKLIDLSLRNIEVSIAQPLKLDSSQIQCTSNSVKILARVIPCTFKYPSIMQIWMEDNKLFNLIKNVIDLLHTPVYSVTASFTIKKTEGIVLALLWKEGLLNQTPTVDANEGVWLRRYELLLLLKAIFSDLPPKFISSRGGSYISNQTFTLQTIYSILNTLITFNPSGIWNLPYTSYYNTLNKERCLKTGLQVLVLINYLSPSQSSHVMSNVRTVLKTLKNREDLMLIWNGILGIVTSIMVSSNTYLPGSQKTFKLNHEVLMFLLTFIKENEGFVHLVVNSDSSLKLIPWILSILLKSTDKSAVSLCSYVLIKLSEQRKFCISLNSLLQSCPLDLPLFSGSYADMSILAISKLILSKSIHQSAVLLLLTFICNFSPYVKSICPLSCHSLIKILQELSLTLNEDTNLEALALHLEVICNFVQYQWRGASGLVFWLLQNSAIVYKLDKLAIEKIKNFLPVCVEVVKSLKDLKVLALQEFQNEIKDVTLVGVLPQPHQIVTRKINFEDEKMVKFVFGMFFVDENGKVVYE